MSNRNYCFTIFPTDEIEVEVCVIDHDSDDQDNDDQDVKYEVDEEEPDEAPVIDFKDPKIMVQVAKINDNFKWDLPLKQGLEEPLCDDVQYCIYQREACPKTGRHHYQGYIEFKRTYTYKQCKSVLGWPSAHLEKRRSKYDDGKKIPVKLQQKYAVNYCSKDETRVLGYVTKQYGSLVSQGARNDVVKVVDSYKTIVSNIDGKASLKKIAKDNPMLYLRYHQGIDKLVTLLKEERNFQTEVHIFFGKSMTGKTRRVYDDAKALGKTVFSKMHGGNGKGDWYNGYDNQNWLLLDDYDGYIDFREFLKLADRYPHKVAVKGSYCEFTCERIYITSNHHPLSWYDFPKRQDFIAFRRRLTSVYYYGHQGAPQLIDVNQWIYSKHFVDPLDSEDEIEDSRLDNLLIN